MRIQTFLPGIYPRSEALVGATQALERGRVSAAEVQAEYERDLDRLLELQRAAGLDYLTDGALNWPDLFRPLLDISAGLEAGALVRFFDNNTFYRRPVINGTLRLRPELLDDWLETFFHLGRGITVASLPSPYCFGQVAQDEADRSHAELSTAYAQGLLLPIAGVLAERGVKLLILQEPWLAVHGPADGEDFAALQASLRELKSALPDLLIGLIGYFGDSAPCWEQLKGLELDAVGLDFWQTDLEALERDKLETGLICGALDARSSLVEEPEMVADFLEQVQTRLAPPALYLSSNAGLEFVPEPIARSKVERLGRIAQIINGRQGGSS